MRNNFSYTERVKASFKNAGFQDVGIAKADFLETEAKQLENWLKEGKHGTMQYLENYFDLRTDPRKLMPGTKSVIVLSSNYRKPNLFANSKYKIANYAYGLDYHKVLRKKVKAVLQKLQSEIGDFQCRICVDSAPVMERAWAEKSGVGWTGKNTLTLTKRKGSWHFLTIVLTDLDLIPDPPAKNYCGACTKCIDACPTNALNIPYSLNASRCISYITIENKGLTDTDLQKNLNAWIFGCDICQEVCPINAASLHSQWPEWEPSHDLTKMKDSDWETLNENTYHQLFALSPVKRAGFNQLKRNIEYIRSNFDTIKSQNEK